MSTRPVSNRSTQVRLPVSGSVSHFALPRRVSSMPSTVTGSSSLARTGSAIATTARWQVFQVVPYAADTSATDRHPSSTAAAISAFARTVNLARGGICGTDSVNCFRSQEVLRHNHFCLHHNRFGKSGPTFTSLGRVTTQPLDRVDTTSHSGHRPTQPGAVNTRTSRLPSAPTPTRSTSISVNPRSSELQLDMLAPLALDA